MIKRAKSTSRRARRRWRVAPVPPSRTITGIPPNQSANSSRPGRKPGRANIADVLAIVVTETVTVDGDPLAVTELGRTEQLPAVGAPVHVSDTGPANPPVLPMVNTNDAVCPAVIVVVDVGGVMEKS